MSEQGPGVDEISFRAPPLTQPTDAYKSRQTPTETSEPLPSSFPLILSLSPMQLIFSALPLLLAALCAHAWGPWHPHHRRDNNTLYATAVVGKNNVSTLECWALQPGFTAVSSQANAMALGDSSGMSYLSVAPGPDYDSGTHNAPHIQYFAILQGSATITFPNTSEVLTCVPGQIYIAADSADVSALGHHTTVAGGSQLIQLPILNGVLPAHNATAGACP